MIIVVNDRKSAVSCILVFIFVSFVSHLAPTSTARACRCWFPVPELDISQIVVRCVDTFTMNDNRLLLTTTISTSSSSFSPRIPLSSSGSNYIRETQTPFTPSSVVAVSVSQTRSARSVFSAGPTAPDRNLMPHDPAEVINKVIENGQDPWGDVDDCQEELERRPPTM